MNASGATPARGVSVRDILILGLGNPLLTDDAVGVRLAYDVAVALADEPHVRWCDIGGAACGLDLLGTFTGARAAILFDALRVTDPQPGRAWHFTLAALAATRHASHVHDMNLATVIHLGRRLGFAVPADEAVHVFGVEVEDDRTFATEMSPRLEACYPDLRDDLIEDVRSLLRNRAFARRAPAGSLHDPALQTQA
jgi:hydrogenase maturation protease